MKTAEFREIIYSNYEKAGRDFPWRKNRKPWGILVSEFMLQQTQTQRVISYWERWMDLWPTPAALHSASMEDVLREWSGLGYNRRGRFIKECAAAIVEKHNGKVPDTPEKLLPLPGIGPYTAGAIACFAYNYPSVFIETNIRAAILHFYFQDAKGITDKEIFPVLEKVLDTENPREWYYALMDYGAGLKKITVNPSRRSAHYKQQSKFEGSFRQLRGKVIRTLVSEGPGSFEEIEKRTGIGEDLYKVLGVLEEELMVAEKAGIYGIRE
ncbi:MAG: A/G-specific adenine glycosylase [Treponema sp.]|jgi:A/G-specific adenine glycosylase|nr:A/G-specific adenine glycosylase [Treponema sp.]